MAPTEDDIDAGFLTERELASLLRTNLLSIQRWRRQGVGPAYVQHGQKLVLFRRADVARWLAEKYVQPAQQVREATAA